MPRMTLDLPQATYDIICREAKEREISKKAAIVYCIDAQEARKKCAKNPQKTAHKTRKISTKMRQEMHRNTVFLRGGASTRYAPYNVTTRHPEKIALKK